MPDELTLVGSSVRDGEYSFCTDVLVLHSLGDDVAKRFVLSSLLPDLLLLCLNLGLVQLVPPLSAKRGERLPCCRAAEGIALRR